jgi:large subunit ribosomal protein L18
MTNRKPRTVAYRRKREGKTNYRKRLNLLLASVPRLVVRVTNKKIIVQLVDFKNTGDLVLVGVDSSALKKYGWDFSFKNLPAAYLVGYLAGKKAAAKDIKKAVLDLGFKPPIKGNKIYACLKGVLDSGLTVAHSPEVFPSEERLSGKHIQKFPKMEETFKQVKQKIESEK